MPNVTRGSRMAGLLVYLAGPGRANEHTEPHLVAGDPAVLAWHDDDELSRDAALAVARHLDAPARVFGTQVAGGHVWHCSLSLRADEGQLTDAQWGSVAGDLVAGMGFGDDGGKAPCRWAAVRHGLSTGGNDHVHLVVDLVREDGTRASVWNDRPRVQRLAGELEQRHGLQVLTSRQLGLGSRGVKPAEVQTARRAGAAEPARVDLARVVRGCGAAARDEAEFVRRVRGQGVLLRPRYAAGTDDVVVGFSAARRPERGARPVWYGGGQLSRDLTLPRLRQAWTDDPQAATEAAAEWRAAARGRRTSRPAGRDDAALPPEVWQRRTDELAAARERLRAVSVSDQGTWAQVAHDTAGAFAAWSLRTEATPGPLARTADVLARSAQVRAHQVQPRHVPRASAGGTALLLATAAVGGRGPVATAALVRQLANTMKALHDAAVAAGDARRAAQIEHVVRQDLAAVAARLPAAAASAPGADVGRAGTGQDRPVAPTLEPVAGGHRRIGSVVPADLERARQPQQRAGTGRRSSDLDR